MISFVISFLLLFLLAITPKLTPKEIVKTGKAIKQVLLIIFFVRGLILLSPHEAKKNF